MRNKDAEFNFYNRYIGRTGAIVELEKEFNTAGFYNKKRPMWSIRFNTSNLIFTGFKNKLQALIFAANKCGLSGQSMNFIPDKQFKQTPTQG